uniref:Cytosolic fatty-acid binding proteins domain-containing protein n=1 Tax=Xiphophorus couchianus TaxID=32473 RepID=A0A3B5MZR5_9TELE
MRQIPDFSGTWEMKSSENFEELLKTLGKQREDLLPFNHKDLELQDTGSDLVMHVLAQDQPVRLGPWGVFVILQNQKLKNCFYYIRNLIQKVKLNRFITQSDTFQGLISLL